MRPNRLHCPIRHENGNCVCVSGFCTAVPEPVCEAVRNAYDSGWTDCALKVRKEQRLKTSPTIEAEPVRHGRWVMTLYTTTSKRGRVVSNKKVACSECGYSNGRKRNNYCPNCGARMDGDSHD